MPVVHVRLLCLPRVCVHHVSALSAQVLHVPSPLDFVRSWPAVQQGCGIIKYKVLSQHCANCMPASLQDIESPGKKHTSIDPKVHLPFSQTRSWKIPQAQATCITRGPDKGGLGMSQHCTRTPHGRALYKDQGTGKRKQNAHKLHTKTEKRTKGKNERQGANARPSFKADKSTAG